MCRWLGYLGAPIAPRELLYEPERSLIEQSRRHAPDMPLPNGDRTGVGWYGTRDIPGLFRSADPAWATRTCASWPPRCTPACSWPTSAPAPGPRCRRPTVTRSGTPTGSSYTTATSPTSHGCAVTCCSRWIPTCSGTSPAPPTRSMMFHLALTFGLRDDPIGGLERMAGFVEAAGAAADVANPLQMTVGVSDGHQIYAARYASGGAVNTLYVSEDVASIRLLYPERERFAHFSDDARVVLSEPLVDLPGVLAGDRARDGPDCRRRPARTPVPSGGAQLMDAPVVTVRGEARLEVPPDLATLSVTVHSSGSTAEPVRDELATASTASGPCWRTTRRPSRSSAPAGCTWPGVRAPVGNQDHRVPGQLQHLDRDARLRRGL